MTDHHPSGADSFAFLCPHCLATLRANAAFEGETRECPNCNQPVKIERANEAAPISSDFPMLDTLTVAQKRILQLDEMNTEQKQTLNEWAFAIYTAGEQAGGQKAIGKIKGTLSNGRTVILDDGSRWSLEVDSEPSSDAWSEEDRVAVIDGEMFNLENGKRITVSPCENRANPY